MCPSVTIVTGDSLIFPLRILPNHTSFSVTVVLWQLLTFPFFQPGTGRLVSFLMVIRPIRFHETVISPSSLLTSIPVSNL